MLVPIPMRWWTKATAARTTAGDLRRRQNGCPRLAGWRDCASRSLRGCGGEESVLQGVAGQKTETKQVMAKTLMIQTTRVKLLMPLGGSQEATTAPPEAPPEPTTHRSLGTDAQQPGHRLLGPSEVVGEAGEATVEPAMIPDWMRMNPRTHRGWEEDGGRPGGTVGAWESKARVTKGGWAAVRAAGSSVGVSGNVPWRPPHRRNARPAQARAAGSQSPARRSGGPWSAVSWEGLRRCWRRGMGSPSSGSPDPKLCPQAAVDVNPCPGGRRRPRLRSVQDTKPNKKAKPKPKWGEQTARILLDLLSKLGR